MKVVLLFFLVGMFGLISSSFSQELGFRGWVAYVERGSSGASYTANVEHFLFDRWGLNANGRLGFGTAKSHYNIKYNTPLYLQAGLNFYSGKRNSHPEVGLYLTYAEGQQIYTDMNKAFYFVPSFSYRFQKPSRGAFFRIGYAPYLKLKEVSNADHVWFEGTGIFNHSFVIALGYSFASRVGER
jgi:hypothetical protein